MFLHCLYAMLTWSGYAKSFVKNSFQHSLLALINFKVFDVSFGGNFRRLHAKYVLKYINTATILKILSGVSYETLTKMIAASYNSLQFFFFFSEKWSLSLGCRKRAPRHWNANSNWRLVFSQSSMTVLWEFSNIRKRRPVSVARDAVTKLTSKILKKKNHYY